MKAKKIVFGAVIAFICTGLVSSVAVESKPPALIRLHIIANSNSSKDQALKYQVRDEVVKTMSEAFKGAKDIEESRRILLSNMYQIENSARITLQEAGCQDNIETYYGQFDFPTKYYGMFSLPAGRYEAVRLVIGEGQGANWWCVLFPPLCFVDGGEKVEYTEQEITCKVNSSLSEQKTVKIKPAFKIVELIKELHKKLANTSV